MSYRRDRAVPSTAEAIGRARRVRRVASVSMLLGGALTLVSALTPSLGNRVAIVEGLLPVWLHQGVFVVAVVSGIGLVQLAGGVRRGQRRAWRAALVVLAVSGVAHVVKGLDIEEAVLAFALTGYLFRERRWFRVRSGPERRRLGQGPWLLGASTLLGIGVAVVSVHVERPRLGWTSVALAVGQRLAGVQSVALHGRLDRLISPALAGLGAAAAMGFVWYALRPLRRGAHPPVSEETARAIVERHGHDSLSYFALRDDKQWWVFGETLIAYAVVNGVCLVSPDPVGPEAQALDAWGAFLAVASDHGWSVAVLGAGAPWLARYEAFGSRSRYIGDEAVVDVNGFSLAGKSMKGLRQAAHRVENKGYAISFHDPATIDPSLADALWLMMAGGRRGHVERGFSMTLSRVFEPADRGLLLAVCTAPDGEPAAFCQFVPAGADGFSLDLMRRASGTHPNGLVDFVLVKTIDYLRAEGRRWLSLNFATMRAVLAGESGNGRAQQLQRWLLERMSDSMQIESLWRYCAKFDPTWMPRYVVYDSAEHLLSVGVAVAKAESFWELPIVGGLFRPASGERARLPSRS